MYDQSLIDNSILSLKKYDNIIEARIPSKELVKKKGKWKITLKSAKSLKLKHEKIDKIVMKKKKLSVPGSYLKKVDDSNLSYMKMKYD